MNAYELTFIGQKPYGSELKVRDTADEKDQDNLPPPAGNL